MSADSVLRRVNRLLSGATGYRFTKVSRGPALDEEMASIIEAVRPYTMTSDEKLQALITAVRYVVQYDIAGDIVECGVWRGGSMQAAARTLASLKSFERDLYLYDTYDGMPPPTGRDVQYDGQAAVDRLATNPKEGSTIWAYASLEDVRSGFESVPYPQERVRFIKGPVEETIPSHVPERIAILRLDTDWYESTRHELEHLYARVVSGGVLILDDYDWWQGARQATDEFLSASGARLLLNRTGVGGRIAVKP